MVLMSVVSWHSFELSLNWSNHTLLPLLVDMLNSLPAVCLQGSMQKEHSMQCIKPQELKATIQVWVNQGHPCAMLCK